MMTKETIDMNDKSLIERLTMAKWFRNEKLIFYSRGLFFILLFFGLSILLFSLVFPKSVITEGNQRVLEKNIYFRNEIIDVDIKPNLNLSCIENLSKNNMVLVLDVSGSMRNYIVELQKAVEEFVSTINWENSTISIVTFDKNATKLLDWSNDKNIVDKSIDAIISTDAGTDISQAILFARNQFSDEQISDETNIIVLFSDGNSDLDPIIREVEIFDSLGGKLFLIGMGETNLSLLREIIIDEDSLILNNNSVTLANSFTEIATRINSIEISIEEEIDFVNFSVVDENIQIENDKLIINDYINKESPFLSYQLSGLKLGFNNISKNTNLFFPNCEDNRNIFFIEKGPMIFILPSLLWIVLLYVLPLLFLGLFGFLKRKKIETVFIPEYSDDYQEPKAKNVFSNNFYKAKTTMNSQYLLNDIKDTISPTFFIGIGKTGYKVLNSLKKQLLDKGEGSIPDGVRILWLGIDEEINDSYLLPNEMHILRPEYDLISIKENQNFDKKIFDWWNERPWDRRNSRIHGRMAFYYDVIFDTKKSLNNILDSVNNYYSELGLDNYNIFIIGSPSEYENAMFIDLSWWIKDKFNHSKHKKKILPWLLLRSSDEFSSIDNEIYFENRTSAVRELNRFLISSKNLFISESGEYLLNEGFLFDACMFFDEFNLDTNSLTPVIDSIVDQMISMLEKNVFDKFYQYVNHFMGVMDRNEPVCITSNSFTFYVPIEPIRRVCEIKLIQEMFFSNKENKGYFSLSSTKSNLSDADLIEYGFGFFSWNGINNFNNQPFDLIPELVKNDYWTSSTVNHLPINIIEGYQWKLIEYLNQYCSKNYENSIQNMTSIILGINHVLKIFKEKVIEEFQNIGKGHLVQEYIDCIPGFEKFNSNLIKNISSWKEKICKDIYNASNRGSKLYSSRVLNKRQELLLNNDFLDRMTDTSNSDKSFEEILESKYSQYLNELNDSLNNSFVRKVILNVEDIDESMKNIEEIVNYYYFRYFLNNDNDDSFFKQIDSNFAWVWEINENKKTDLKFYIRIDNNDFDSKYKSFDDDNLNEIFDSSLSIVKNYSRIIRENIKLSSILKSLDDTVVEDLRNSEKNKFLNYSLDQNSGNMISKTILVNADEVQSDRWERMLPNMDFDYCNSVYENRITMLNFIFKVPIKSIKLLQQDLSKTYSRSIQVYNSEIIAEKFEIENKLDQKFHPKFVQFMENKFLFELTTYSLFYGWLMLDFDKQGEKFWKISFDEKIEFKIVSETIIKGLDYESLFKNITIEFPVYSLDETHPLHRNNLDSTEKLFIKHLKNIRNLAYKEKKERFTDIEEKLIPALKKSKSVFDRNLAIYLLELLDREKRF